MPYSVEQKDWLLETAKVSDEKDIFDQEQAEKEVLIQRMSEQLESAKTIIQSGAQVEVVLANGTKMKTLDIKGSQETELDTRELRNTKRGPTVEELQKLKVAQQKIDELRSMLESKTVQRLDPATGKLVEKPLFSREELVEELYMPLVRERVWPENFVPDTFSKTQEMLNATNKLYDDRLKQYTEDLATGDESEEDLLQKTLGSGSKLMKVGKDILGVFGTETKLAADILNLVGMGLDTANTTYTAVKESDLINSSNTIADALGLLAAQAVAVITGNDSLKATISGAVSAGGQMSKALLLVGSKGKEGVKPALECFANGLSGALMVAAGECRKNPGDQEKGDILATLSVAVKGTYLAASQGVDVAKKVQDGDLQGVVDGLTKAAKTVLSTAFSAKAQESGGKPSEEDKRLELQLTTGIDLAQLGITTIVVISQAQGTSAANTVIDNVGTLLTGVLKLATKDEKAATAAGNAYAAAVAPAKIGLALSKRPEPDVNGAIDEFTKGFTAAFKAADPNNRNPRMVSTSIQVANTFRSLARARDLPAKLMAGDLNGVIDTLTGVSKEAVKLAKTVSPNPESIDAERIIGEIDTGGKLAKVAVLLVDAVKSKQIADKTDALVSNISEALGDALALAGVPNEVAQAVQSAYAAATAPALVASYLCREEPDKGKALEAIGNGFEQALKLAAPDNPECARAGATLNQAFKSVGSGIDIVKMIKAGKVDQAMKQLEQSATAVIAAGLNVELEETVEEEGEGAPEDPEAESDAEDTKKQREEAKNKAKSFLKNSGAKDALVGELTKEDVQESVVANVNEAQNEEALEDLRREQQELEELNLLRTGGTDGGIKAAEVRKIENLIKEMQRDRMMLDLAAKISQAGLSVAAKFCPALQAGASAVKLAANIIAAANRGMALNKWYGNRKDLLKAQNPLSSSAQNFVTNQAKQLSHYSIQAALELAQMIGSIVSCSGLATAAGEALSKSAAAASTAEEVLNQLAKDYDFEKGWKTYQEALKDPKNRKLGLKARRLNPTLAKYSFAWAAIKKNDPLAKTALASCGLGEESLANEANVDEGTEKVVQYLEICFPDDNIILKRVEITAEWVPKPVELTLKSWSACKSRGESKGKLKAGQATGAIESALARLPEREALEGQLAEVQKKAEAKDTPYPELSTKLTEVTTYVGELDELANSLEGYAPKHAEDENLNHPEMTSVRDEFVAMSRAKALTVSKVEKVLVARQKTGV